MPDLTCLVDQNKGYNQQQIMDESDTHHFIHQNSLSNHYNYALSNYHFVEKDLVKQRLKRNSHQNLTSSQLHVYDDHDDDHDNNNNYFNRMKHQSEIDLTNYTQNLKKEMSSRRKSSESIGKKFNVNNTNFAQPRIDINRIEENEISPKSNTPIMENQNGENKIKSQDNTLTSLHIQNEDGSFDKNSSLNLDDDQQQKNDEDSDQIHLLHSKSCRISSYDLANPELTNQIFNERIYKLEYRQKMFQHYLLELTSPTLSPVQRKEIQEKMNALMREPLF